MRPETGDFGSGFKAASPNSLVYRNECLPGLLKLGKGVSLYQHGSHRLWIFFPSLILN